jgi:uncharacterized OB-fold protein
MRTPRANAETAPFWEGCRRGELLYQACLACGRAQFPPRARCAHCHEGRLEWRRSAGRGAVHSFTVVERAPSAEFATPYVLALVDLDEGFRMMLNLRECAPARATLGMRVRVVYEVLEDGGMLPQAAIDRSKS